MEKIDLAEILKDCPTGMELDCTLYDNCTFEIVFKGYLYPIQIQTPEGLMSLTKYGSLSSNKNSKCVIFPKGKTTWKGFQRPFKDGDIVATEHGVFIGIVKAENNGSYETYCAINGAGSLSINTSYCFERLATEEEKEKLFKAIKDNGYSWNPETKALEELFPYKIGTKVWVKSDKEHKYIHTIVGISSNSFGNLEYEIKEEKTGTVVHYPKDLLIPVTEEKPKFKVGDRIILKNNQYNIPSIRINAVINGQYILENGGFLYIDSTDEKYVLENKFDINTLIPFESRVLVRDNDYDEWKGAFWSHLRQKADIKYDTIRGVYRQCIPYNDDTKHLLGKTNSCDDYYKIWK